MALKDLIKKISGDVVTREVDGFTFTFYKNLDGKFSEYPNPSKLKVAEVTQDNVTFELNVGYSPSLNSKPERVYYEAYLTKYKHGIKHLILPYSIKYKNHEYRLVSGRINNTSDKVWIFPNDSNIEEITIGWNFLLLREASYAKVLAGFTNLKKVHVLPTANGRLLASTVACYSEKQLSQSDKVFVPDGFVTCPVPLENDEMIKRYNTEVIIEHADGFWNKHGEHIKVLSLPNNFFIYPNDFSHIIRKYKKWSSCEEQYSATPSPIRSIILRETIDNPELYNFKFDFSNLKNQTPAFYAQIFGDTTLYVHKKHLRTLDDKIGPSIFKDIKSFEELPEEFRFLLGEPSPNIANEIIAKDKSASKSGATSKKEPKKEMIANSSKQISLNRETVEGLANMFHKQFGSVLRIYNGQSKADDSLRLQEVGLTGTIALPFNGNLKVGEFITQMAQVGLKVKVYTCDDWVACLDDLTLTQTGQVKKNATKADMEKLL